VPFLADSALPTATVFTAQGRYGNNAINGDWELGITTNTNKPPQQQTGHVWNGSLDSATGVTTVREQFTFDVLNTTAASFSVGGSNISFDYAGQLTGNEPNAIKIWAKASTADSGLTIANLKLTAPGMSVPMEFPAASIAVSQSSGPGFQQRLIAGVDFSSGSGQSVTLTGDLGMSFAQTSPRGSSLQFHVMAVYLPVPIVTVDVAPGQVTEDGPQNLTYTFTATGPLTRDVTVKYEVGGTATEGGDFTGAPSGTGVRSITIPATASPTSSATLTITPTPDTVIEDDETVAISLLPSAGYTFDPNHSLATATIIDDDGNVVTISATDDAADEVMAGPELPSTGTFRLSRSGSLAKDLPVKLRVGGSATYRAFAVDDYALSTVQSGLTGYFATIPSGQAFVDIVVTPFQDGTNEDTETVTLSIEQYTGYTVGPRGQATVSILDAPDLSAASVAFRIDMDARPATRCWPVDPAERRLPQVPQDTLRTGEPYVFSLADIGTERTAGVSGEVSYDIIQAIGAPGGAVTVTASSGSATGTSFLRTFAVDEERVTTLFGTTTHDRWQVHFFVDANRNGRRDAAESFTVGRFNDVLQDRKAIWLCRLEEEKKAHAGTIYNDVFGVTAFFDELIATVKNVSFGRNGDPNALAIYGFMTNTIGVNDAENVEGGIATIIHESVHALDDTRNWTPPLRPVLPDQFDAVEAIAWTAQHLLDPKGRVVKPLRDFEDLLKASNPDSTAVEFEWKTVVQGFHSFTGLNVSRPWGDRPVTLDDVQTTRAAVGLHFNMTALMAAYQQRLDDQGVPITLEATTSLYGVSRSIPNVFLE
jgi:hypothetical protein